MDALLDIENYIHAVASAEPVPGGGSVAGVVAGLGAALGAMVTNFTLGKKKYAAYQKEAEATLINLNDNIRKFMDLAQKDINTFSVVSKAYSLPKETEADKIERNKAIENASEVALKVPFEIMRLCSKISEILKKLSLYGNANLDSDMAGSALLIKAASETAYYCVYANLPFIKDVNKTDAIKASLIEMQLHVKNDCQEILTTVSKRMNIT